MNQATSAKKRFNKIAFTDEPTLGRVAVFTAPREVELRQEPVPEPGPGEALVHLRACALCTMEQRLWRGRQTHYPIIPGHEAAGVVVKTHPEGVSGVTEGDRVAIAFLDRCMQCEPCRRGETNLCTGKLLGRAPGKLRRIGGLADYAAVPAWKLLPVPEELAFREIALSEPVACVIHSIHRGRLRFGDDVLVIGAGTMGQLHLLLARLSGTRVFVSDPDPFKREVALEHGASAAWEPGEAVEQLRAQTRGRGADAVFVTFGDPQTAAQAAGAVRDGGRILYYGSFPPQAETGLGPGHLHHHEVTLDGARGQTLADWNEATRLLAAGLLDLRHLISETYPLDRLEDALEHAATGGPFRVVVGG